ncbi:MAG: type I restriction endonuclease [Bacillus sp. (in: firmicutes)]
MDSFVQQIKSLASRVERIKENILTEEATKTSLVMPLIQALGYDVFNPEEFIPEFIADVGIKKGEKIDYAIMDGGNPVILIEAKCVHEKLQKHDSQLFRYFGTTKAKFAILTNGVEYKFFTDLEEPNKMDERPFFVFNLLELRDNHILELAKFRKSVFNVENVLITASDLKYTNEVKKFLSRQWEDPGDAFIKFILADVYQGVKTKRVIENFRDIVKQSLSQIVNEKVNDKLQKALSSTDGNEAGKNVDEMVAGAVDEQGEHDKSGSAEETLIVTTEEEIEGYVLIKIILSDQVDANRIFYRDNKSYFNVLLDDNIRKWICRLFLNNNNKTIQLNDEARTTYKIDNVNDILQYKEQIKDVSRQFL